MRQALAGLPRFIATATTRPKHRIFVWLDPMTLPDHALLLSSLAATITSFSAYFIPVLKTNGG